MTEIPASRTSLLQVFSGRLIGTLPYGYWVIGSAILPRLMNSIVDPDILIGSGSIISEIHSGYPDLDPWSQNPPINWFWFYYKRWIIIFLTSSPVRWNFRNNLNPGVHSKYYIIITLNILEPAGGNLRELWSLFTLILNIKYRLPFPKEISQKLLFWSKDCCSLTQL